MLAPILLRGGSRKRMVTRFGFLGVMLGVLLAATFVFHLSGTALVELRIARLILVVALVVGLGLISRRRGRNASDGTSRSAAMDAKDTNR